MKKHLCLLISLFVINTYYSQYSFDSIIRKNKECDNWGNLLVLYPNYKEVLSMEIIQLQDLVEKSLVLREGMSRIADKIKSNKKGPIASSDINYLRSNTQNCIQLRNDLLKLAYKYRFALKLEEKEKNINNNISKEIKSKAIFISLSSALVLYDNYILGAILLEEDKRLRKFFNESDKGFGITKNQLQEITLSANSVENQLTIKHGIDYFEENKSFINETNDAEFEYLSELILSSPSFNYLKNIGINELSAKKFKMLSRITSDLIKKTKEQGSNSISKFFGNSMGIIETRKGKLYGKQEVLDELKSQLQPLDVLLEKTPFRLTDKFIPGHFGHVAIWVGTKKELIEKGIWENELIKPYQTLINPDSSKIDSKDGKHIVEALRDGVQINSLNDFMNVDDMVILRPIFLENNLDLQIESLLLTFRQLGKEYDFNFDVNTTEKIVCSELAYCCFPTIDWETKKMAGRYTISPDNVASLCINGKLFEVVTFYHDGRKCTDDEKLTVLKELLEKK